MANFKMVQEFSGKAYFLPLPEYGYEVVIKSNQLIDDTSKLGIALLKYYGENVQYEGETKSLMEKVASGEIGGSGTSLTTEQTDAIAKIEGLKASASEIDNGIINYDETGTHVFILAGQSNMVGWDVFSNTKGDYSTGVMQVARTGKTSGGLDNELVQAISPLDNWDANAGTMGLSLEFAHKYKEQFPNVQLVFIPCAQGGTGFISNNWNKGNTLYEDTVARANTLFTNNPTFKLKGMLWHQGETDYLNLDFELDLTTFLTDIRTDISVMSDDVPIFIGGLVPPNLVIAGMTTNNNILKSLDKKVKNVFFADSLYPYALTNMIGQQHHFNSDGLNNMGHKYFVNFIRSIEKTYKSQKVELQEMAPLYNAVFTGSIVNYGGNSVSSNISYGLNALKNNIAAGKNNSAFGNNALSSNTIGERNVAIGNNTLLSAISGYNNIAIGAEALKLATGSNNIAIGSEVLYKLTTGSNNNFIGADTGKFLTTGSGNTAFGSNALQNNVTGGNNVAIGLNALKQSTGGQNTAIGANALAAITSGENNVAVGFNALSKIITASNNIGIGYGATSNLTTGNSNVAIGIQSMDASTIAAANVCVGQKAGFNITSGSGNVVVGSMNNANGYLPAYNITTENNYISMGSTAVTNAYIQVAWTVVSDERDKTDFDNVPHGLDFVSKLKPIKYKFRESRDSDVAVGDVKYGFKAQDILALEGDDSVIVDNKDIDKLRYTESNLIPILVKAIQELKYEIEILKSKA